MIRENEIIPYSYNFSPPLTPSDHADHTFEDLLTFDGLHLKGLWSVPKVQPRAVTLLLSGTGNCGIDGDISSPILGFGYNGQPAKILDQLNDTYLRSGVVTYRFEKRGFRDPSQLANQNFDFLSRDAESAIQLILSRYPNLPLILGGFSEGALISFYLAPKFKPKALFLPALPTRHIDENLRYQFIEWPLRLIKRVFQIDDDGILTEEDFKRFPEFKLLPFLGNDLAGREWRTLERHTDGTLPLESQIRTAYEKNFENVKALFAAEPLKTWYQVIKNVPDFAKTAEKIHCPVFLYQGTEDAHFSPEAIREDLKFFSGNTQITYFEGLGHCFAPMTGSVRELRTSGPLDSSFLKNLKNDLDQILI